MCIVTYMIIVSSNDIEYKYLLSGGVIKIHEKETPMNDIHC